MIDNKTILASSLESFLSSGMIDVIQLEDGSKNPVRDGIVNIGDRKTIVLDQLDRNFYFINLNYLGVGRTIICKFKTDRKNSFSLHHSGNYNTKSYNVRLNESAKLLGRGTVRNLEKYFTEDEVLDFTICIYKANSYTYELSIMTKAIGDPTTYNTIRYIGENFNHQEIIKAGTSYTIIPVKKTEIATNARSLDNWNTSKDGSGVKYLVGETITPVGDLTLFPIWQEMPNTVPVRVKHLQGTYRAIAGETNDVEDKLLMVYPEEIYMVRVGDEFIYPKSIVDTDDYKLYSSNKNPRFIITGPSTLKFFYSRPNLFTDQAGFIANGWINTDGKINRDNSLSDYDFFISNSVSPITIDDNIQYLTFSFDIENKGFSRIWNNYGDQDGLNSLVYVNGEPLKNPAYIVIGKPGISHIEMIFIKLLEWTDTSKFQFKLDYLPEDNGQSIYSNFKLEIGRGGTPYMV